MQSPLLDLPFILPAQAQKHVTHNEALQRLDAAVQLGVVSRALAEPPAAAVEGARYIVGSPAAGAWAGEGGRVASWQDGAWLFLAPRAGWLAFVADEDALLLHDGGSWRAAGPALLGGLDRLGVNARAHGPNRLALRSAASLFDHEGAGHRVAINKAASAETASILFQQSYSGRAEIGLAGEAAFSLKTSADGAAWRESLRADPASGRVTFPSGAGGVAIPIMGNSGTPVSAGQTRYLSPGLNATTAPGSYVTIPAAGRFSALTCFTAGSPGTNESWTFTLQNLFSDTPLTCTIRAGTNQAADMTNSVRFAAGGRWSIKMVASSGAATSGNVLFSMLFTPE